jgi:hypothetical protein
MVLFGSHKASVILQSEEPVGRFYEGACLLCTEWDEMLKVQADASNERPFATAETFKVHLANHLKDTVTWTVPDEETIEREQQKHSTASTSAHTRPPSLVDTQDFEPGSRRRHAVSKRTSTIRASSRSSSTYDSHVYRSMRDDSSDSG